MVYDCLFLCVWQFTIFNESTVVVHKNEIIELSRTETNLLQQLTMATPALVLIQVSTFAGFFGEVYRYHICQPVQ